MIRHWLSLTATLALAASAQDGGQLYETYCGACHAPDGQGATGGQFPPLAGSEWIQGPPDRAIQIVLHGLQGPIEVQGKPFNLMMPPQGAVLPDDQIAAILTHVRSSWGNEETKVTPQMVATARAATAKRTAPWTAPEILERHPLPKQPTALRNLTSRIYHGEWKKLPDFSKLTAENVEEEHDGILSLTQADRKEHFGIVWEADFIAPKEGEYVFRFACDDGGRILLDGEVMLEVHGLGPMGGGRTQAAKLTLEEGAHPIRIEYYEYTGQEGISISWKGPDSKDWQELSDTKLKPSAKGPPSIPIAPTNARAAIYRNFIKGTTPRAIGIGFPGGVNFAYSADHLAPELIWTGKFMDAGLHWTNRGVGAQPPAGENVVKLTKSPAFPEGARFHGYQLDDAGNPTFSVSLGDSQILDSYIPIGSAGFQRVLKHQGGKASVLLAEDLPIEKVDAGWLIDGTIVIGFDHTSPELRDGKLFLELTPSNPPTLTYSWK